MKTGKEADEINLNIRGVELVIRPIRVQQKKNNSDGGDSKEGKTAVKIPNKQ